MKWMACSISWEPWIARITLILWVVVPVRVTHVINVLIFPEGCQPREEVRFLSEMLNTTEQHLVLKLHILGSGHRERAMQEDGNARETSLDQRLGWVINMTRTPRTYKEIMKGNLKMMHFISLPYSWIIFITPGMPSIPQICTNLNLMFVFKWTSTSGHTCPRLLPTMLPKKLLTQKWKHDFPKYCSAWALTSWKCQCDSNSLLAFVFLHIFYWCIIFVHMVGLVTY